MGSRAGVYPHGCAGILLRTTQKGVRLLGKNKVLASSSAALPLLPNVTPGQTKQVLGWGELPLRMLSNSFPCWAF